MSVLLETSVGDLVIDLHIDKCPKTTFNFLKLCKIKYYNNCLFYEVQKDYLVQTGDPSNKGQAGSSIWGIVEKDPSKMFFEDEIQTKNGKISQRFNKKGIVAMANKGPNLNGSAFFITLSDEERPHLNNKHTIFGQVVEGLENLEKINQIYCDNNGKPYQNIRIKHTVIIDEGKFEDQDPKGMRIPSRSPSPIVIRQSVLNAEGQAEEYEDRLEDDVDIEELMKNKTEEDIQKEILEHQTKTRAAVLEIIEDLPDADIEPPKNVLFVCKLNPVTQDGDLRLIFSRYGAIKCCEVIRDWKTGDSLQYAFIEFETEEACIEAYSRMEGVAIDERRIHVDFSQSVAKQWNQYRRKMLQTAADQILQDERKMREKEKERQVYNLFANYKDKEKDKEKENGRGSDRDRRKRDEDYKERIKKHRYSRSGSKSPTGEYRKDLRDKSREEYIKHRNKDRSRERDHKYRDKQRDDKHRRRDYSRERKHDREKSRHDDQNKSTRKRSRS